MFVFLWLIDGDNINLFRVFGFMGLNGIYSFWNIFYNLLVKGSKVSITYYVGGGCYAYRIFFGYLLLVRESLSFIYLINTNLFSILSTNMVLE